MTLPIGPTLSIQVDMLIANGSFLAHPKITNPTDRDLRGALMESHLHNSF